MRAGQPALLMRLAAIAAALILLVQPTVGQEALKGLALVIGQSEYEGLAPLTNPENDARALDDLLDGLGFDVNRVLDADADDLREELEDFVKDAADADVALIYYSGHGIEVGGENYLIPIDADVSTPEAAGEKLIPLGALLDELRAKVPVTIFLLDACRTNSFPPGQLVHLPGEAAPIAVSEQGLAVTTRGGLLVEAATSPEGLGMVVGFAASPGQAALDGDGENSPYAAALLKHLGAGAYAFGDVMTMVKEEVYLETSGRQLPWTNDALRRFLYFGKAIEETGNDEALIREGRRELLLTIATAPADTRGVVESVAASENVPLDALYGMLKVLGVDTSAGPAALDKQLRDGAERVKQFMTEAPGTAKTDAELIRLSELADRAQAEGAMDVALMFRERASARADELSASRDVLEEQLREDRLEIAETYAEHGETAALVFDFRTAEEKFAEAFDEVEGWDDEKALEYKAVLASTRYWRGEKEGSVESMQLAVADYEVALKYVSRDDSPGEWAFIHRGIATAQTALAEWSGDPAQFEAAIAAFREVLAVLPPEQRVQRAITLSNLGLAYQSLAYRRIGTAELELSLEALLEAKKLVPDGETIRLLENSIGLTLGMIGFRERDEEKLRRAAAILKETIANDLEHPFDIAKVQANLGLVLTELGSLTSDPDLLQGAVEVLRQALEVQKRDTAPQDWASVEFNLGLALTNLGKVGRDETKLGEAIAAFDLALEQFERSRAPLLWAVAMRDRANAYFEVSQLTGEIEPAIVAKGGYEQALEELDRIRAPGEWSKTQTARLIALTWLGKALPDTQLVIDALEVGAEIETALTPEASPLDWATLQRHLGDLDVFLFEFEDNPLWLEPAAAAYRSGAAVAPMDSDPVLWLRLHHNLAETLGEIAARAGDPAGMDEAYEIALSAFSRGVLLDRSALHGDNVLWALGQLMTTLDSARLLLNDATAAVGAEN